MRSVRSYLILLFDLIAIVLVFSGVYFLRLDQLPDFTSPGLWLITITFISVLFLSGTYFREGHAALPSMPVRTFFVCFVAGSICVIWLYLLGPHYFNQYFGRGTLPVGTTACGVLTTLVRYFVNRAYYRHEQLIEILYLGYSDNGKLFLRELKNHSEVRSVILATSKSVSGESELVSVNSAPPSKLLDSNHWQGIIIDPSYIPDKQQTEQLVQQRLGGTPVFSLASFYEKYWYMVPVHGIDNEWFLRSLGFSVLDHPVSRRIKRSIDILFSSVLLALTLPLILLCALIIKLSSHGPAIFKQTRIGLQGREFTIYKLRTMRHDAESAELHCRK